MIFDEDGDDEPDPEEQLDFDVLDAEEDLGPDAPTPPEPPEAPAPPEPPSEMDAPSGLLRDFWVTVLLANVVLLAGSLGFMFVVFRGEWRLGGGLGLVALVALGRAYLRYRRSEHL